MKVSFLYPAPLWILTSRERTFFLSFFLQEGLLSDSVSRCLLGEASALPDRKTAGEKKNVTNDRRLSNINPGAAAPNYCTSDSKCFCLRVCGGKTKAGRAGETSRAIKRISSSLTNMEPLPFKVCASFEVWWILSLCLGAGKLQQPLSSFRSFTGRLPTPSIFYFD